MTEVFTNEDWYRSRPEPERTWRGTLVRVTVIAGPRSRTALTHSLKTSEGEVPVYGGGVGTVLAPFENRVVRVAAKLVDLSSEGFGRELWIGSIEVAISAS